MCHRSESPTVSETHELSHVEQRPPVRGMQEPKGRGGPISDTPPWGLGEACCGRRAPGIGVSQDVVVPHRNVTGEG